MASRSRSRPSRRDDEAITKLASGAVDVDLHHSASTTTLFKLVDTGSDPAAQQDLSHQHRQCHLVAARPVLRQGRRSTPCRTRCYSTGIGFRADRVDAASVSWDTLWNPDYKGVTSLLDDYREGLTAALLRKGVTDVNTEDPAVIKQAGDDLGELTNLMNIKVEIEGYHTVPEGSTTVAHTWSGDMLNAQYYLPDGTGIEVLAYWQPETAVVSNDTMCVLSKAKSPVLAHLFMNELLDKDNAQTNFGYVGYQPAVEGLGAQELIDAGLVPENLRSCVLSNDQISKGLRYLPLSADVEALWNGAWSKFRAGA